MTNPNTIAQLLQSASELHKRGQLNQAQQLYQQILAARPDHPDALHLLGVLVGQNHQFQQSAELIRQAIKICPTNALYYRNLGIALDAAGQVDEAITAYQHALRLQPDFAPVHYNLAIALASKGQIKEAILAYREAIRCQPDFVNAHYNLANTLISQGQLDEAIASYRQVLRFKPDFAEACDNLGLALTKQGHLDEAIACFRHAIQLQPQLATAHNHLGNALSDQGRIEEAIQSHRQAVACAPNHPLFHSNLIFILNYHPASDMRAVYDEARRWNQLYAAPLASSIAPHANARSADRKIRIGYLSPDLIDHVVGRFLLPLLSQHDRGSFDICCYSASPTPPDSITLRLRQHTDLWRDIAPLTDEQAASLIREDRIDILVDLAMHSSANRLTLFARKPAPVQLTWLAYCGTTGVDAIDYRLSDPYLDPPPTASPGGDETCYSEKTLHLPDTFWCYQPHELAAPVSPLRAATRGIITFGCLNAFCKISPQALDTWATLLRTLDQAQLLIHCQSLSQRQEIRQFFRWRNVDPRRLDFVGRAIQQQYFQFYHSVDIALDPFPFAGGTTTCDALWMGVPVVTLAGRTGVGRGGVSILSNIGLPDLIAQSPDQYIAIASSLARDLPRLAGLRSTLRQRMQSSPLMDAPRFARAVESAYRQMWRHYCNSPPEVP